MRIPSHWPQKYRAGMYDLAWNSFGIHEVYPLSERLRLEERIYSIYVSSDHLGRILAACCDEV